MTRKDYEAIARVFKRYWPTDDKGTDVYRNCTPDDIIKDVLGALVDDISNVLALDNPRFDRERFRKATGVDA